MKPRELYRDFIIDLHDWAGFQAVHVDYDGPEDSRAFTGRSRAEIVEQIDEWHDEQREPTPFWLKAIAWLILAAFMLGVLFLAMTGGRL